MSAASNALANYESGHNPVRQAVAVLQRQSGETAELQVHVDRARENIDGASAPKIRSLLDALSAELNACGVALQKRTSSLSCGPVGPRPHDVGSASFWRLYRADGSDCPSHLEALLSGYAHYARATGDSLEFLKRLGDAESVRVVERLAAVAGKGLWFIELYMEALALHTDMGRLPDFSPMAGINDMSHAVRNAG